MSLRRFYRNQPLPDLSKVPEVLTLTVDEAYDGWRLDRFLGVHLTWASRTNIQARIAGGQVRKNGQPVPAARRVRYGDTIELDVPPPSEDLSLIDTIELPVLHEDEWFVAINKPANLLVHPVGRRRFSSVINILHAEYRRPDDPDADVIPLLAHRIDQETTGTLLVTKSREARRQMTRLFEGGHVLKEYLALIEGHVNPPAGLIDLPIGSRSHEIHFVRGINFDDGQEARSLYRVERRLPGHDLVRVRLIHGRQHQIRLHFEALGHPLVGDPFYGMRRQLLRARAQTLAGQTAPPLPDLPPADELFASPDALPLLDQPDPAWCFRRTMIPEEGADPWAAGTEDELLAQPDYEEAIPEQRPLGFNPDPGVLIDRVALHAARLGFGHPFVNGTDRQPLPMDIRAPLPPDLAEAVAVLDGEA